VPNGQRSCSPLLTFAHPVLLRDVRKGQLLEAALQRHPSLRTVEQGRRGWTFYAKTLTGKQLVQVEAQLWVPFEISLGENVVLGIVMNNGGLALDDADLLNAAENHGLNLREFADRLVAAR